MKASLAALILLAAATFVAVPAASASPTVVNPCTVGTILALDEWAVTTANGILTTTQSLLPLPEYVAGHATYDVSQQAAWGDATGQNVAAYPGNVAQEGPFAATDQLFVDEVAATQADASAVVTDTSGVVSGAFVIVNNAADYGIASVNSLVEVLASPCAQGA